MAVVARTDGQRLLQTTYAVGRYHREYFPVSISDLLRAPGDGLPNGVAPRRLALITIAVIGFSAWIGLAVPLLGARDMVGALGPLLSIAGAVLSFRSWRVGLGLSALAPVVATALGRDPAGVGSLAVMIALLLALRGASALLVGAVVTAANLIAGLSYYGLTDFSGRWPSFVAIGAVVTAAVGTAVRAHSDVRDGRAQHERDVQQNEALSVKSAVAEERVRIARDLHDSIGHGIAVISMHVGTAEVVTPAGETDTHASLRSARLAIQAVLEDTQQTLRMLRVPSDAPSPLPITHPDALPSLVQSVQAAGLQVVYRTTGSLAGLPLGASAAIYRIVQEMLTNAQRHSLGQMTLSVTLAPHAVIISSKNLCNRTTTTVGGNGLVGMRERAESLGGALTVDSTDDTFEITATIPVHLASSAA